MKPKISHNALFSDLEKWSDRKDSYSISEFLFEKGVTYSDFDLIANSSKKFMKIWGIAESRAWDNVKEAIFTKSLPRSRIADYIRESDLEGDPEEVMQSLEEEQAKLELYLTAVGDTDSIRKYGRIGKIDDFEALMKCSLELGMVTQEAYNEIMVSNDEEDDD